MTGIKVVTPDDMGKGLVLNPQTGQYEVVVAGGATIELEPVVVNNFHDGWGNYIDQAFGININGQNIPINKVARIKGTNWLVFGSTQLP